MGTIDRWMRVVLTGSVWIFLMLLVGAFNVKPSRTKTPLLGTNVYLWVSWGLLIGLLSEFSWGAFQRPLVFVTGTTFVAGLAAGWIGRPKPAVDERPPSSS